MVDLINRQDAINTRRYTFGNDEFSLEAAYHDCKLVFDGITDDDSFQEADTGLILYYANEIIYALQEALKGKDTNVLTNDCISRKAAIDKLKNNMAYMQAFGCDRAIMLIRELPSAQPERKKGKWVLCRDDTLFWNCSCCGELSDYKYRFCPDCGADMRGDTE